jgi:hypothetical protein
MSFFSFFRYVLEQFGFAVNSGCHSFCCPFKELETRLKHFLLLHFLFFERFAVGSVCLFFLYSSFFSICWNLDDEVLRSLNKPIRGGGDGGGVQSAVGAITSQLTDQLFVATTDGRVASSGV